MMPSMAKNDDQWIASVVSYIRNSGDLGNNASVVTAQEVKYVRDSVPGCRAESPYRRLKYLSWVGLKKNSWGNSADPADKKRPATGK